MDSSSCLAKGAAKHQCDFRVSLDFKSLVALSVFLAKLEEFRPESDLSSPRITARGRSFTTTLSFFPPCLLC